MLFRGHSSAVRTLDPLPSEGTRLQYEYLSHVLDGVFVHSANTWTMVLRGYSKSGLVVLVGYSSVDEYLPHKANTSQPITNTSSHSHFPDSNEANTSKGYIASSLTVDNRHAVDDLVDLLHNSIYQPRQEHLPHFLGKRVVKVAIAFQTIEYLLIQTTGHF